MSRAPDLKLWPTTAKLMLPLFMSSILLLLPRLSTPFCHSYHRHPTFQRPVHVQTQRFTGANHKFPNTDAPGFDMSYDFQPPGSNHGQFQGRALCGCVVNPCFCVGYDTGQKFMNNLGI